MDKRSVLIYALGMLCLVVSADMGNVIGQNLVILIVVLAWVCDWLLSRS